MGSNICDDSSDVRLGARVKVDGSIGTVRYIGPVKGTSGDWIGIEWDESARGKHDGVYDHIRYFTCDETRGNCASFVRIRKINCGKSFLDAFYERYGGRRGSDGDQEEEMFIVSGGKTVVNVELVGKEKIRNAQSRFQSLSEVGLARAEISTSQHKGTENISTVCPNICNLDLSGNLLSDWDTIGDIIQYLPELDHLDLSSNRFSVESGKGTLNCVNLRVLFLNSTLISFKDLKTICNQIGNLKEVHFCKNNITEMNLGPSSVSNRLSQVTLLNLEGNNLTWSEVSKLSTFMNLETLIVNQNKIEEIEYPGSAEGIAGFPSLETLSLSENQISKWDSVNALNDFPALKTLKLTRNPICKGEKPLPGGYVLSPSDFRAEAIARIGSLVRMNNSNIHPRERIDAERDFIRIYLPDWEMVFVDSEFCHVDEITASSMLKDNYKTFLKGHPRYHELLRIHQSDYDYKTLLQKRENVAKGEEEATVNEKNSTLLELEFLFVSSTSPLKVDETLCFRKKIPKVTSIAKLKTLIHRLFSKQVRSITTPSTSTVNEYRHYEQSSLSLFFLDVDASYLSFIDEDTKPISFYASSKRRSVSFAYVAKSDLTQLIM